METVSTSSSTTMSADKQVVVHSTDDQIEMIWHMIRHLVDDVHEIQDAIGLERTTCHSIEMPDDYEEEEKDTKEAKPDDSKEAKPAECKTQ